MSVQRGIYRHFKDEKMIYEVLGIAKHTEDSSEHLVIYRALYGEYTLYARPESMFLELVDKPEFNYKGPRFIFIKAL